MSGGVFRKLDWENTGLRINGEYLGHLTFADDILSLSESAVRLQKMPQELQLESMAMELKINVKKSKVMINKHAENALFSICNETLEK